MTPTDKEVQAEKNRRAKRPRNLRRKVRELESKLALVELENIGYGYACQTLRYSMGLDNTKTDLRKCLIAYEGLKAKIEQQVQMAVNASCSCGGKGPQDGCCQACEVWHRFHGRQVRS